MVKIFSYVGVSFLWWSSQVKENKIKPMQDLILIVYNRYPIIVFEMPIYIMEQMVFDLVLAENSAVKGLS